MDLNTLVVASNDFIQGHTHDALMILLGVVTSHPAACADLIFKAVMASPFKPLFLRLYPTVQSWADAFETELAKNVEAHKKEEEASAPAAPSAATTPAPPTGSAKV